MTTDPEPGWMDGAAAHALALLLAGRRFGPGVDMGGAHNPTPGEEAAGKRFMQDLINNGWLNPAEVERLTAWHMLHMSPECQHTNAHDGCDETVVCRGRCWCPCHYAPVEEVAGDDK